MSRLFQTLTMYVLWLIGVISVFIGSCLTIRNQMLLNCSDGIVVCWKLNQLLKYSPMVLGFLFAYFAIYFIILTKKTKKYINGLILYNTDCYKSNEIEVFQQKYSVQIHVVDCNDLLAFTFGFIHPQILVSTSLINLLEPYELEAVLEHEYYHYRHRDPFKSSIWLSLARVFSFLPVSRMLYERYMVEKEIAADTFAIHKVGIKSVASALYKLMTHVPTYSLAVAHFQNHILQDTNMRIEVLLTGTYKRPPISLLEWIRSIVHILFINFLIGCVSFL